MTLATSYRFGEFTLDPASYRLQRGDALVALTPKAFEILVLLVQQRHRGLTKSEIFDAVWPATAVSENTLTQRIKEIREAIGDTARAPLYLRTIPRVGFQFVGDVTEGGPAVVRRSAAALGPIKAIAVLPFTNLSTDPDNAYFADGLTDEVTANLSRVRALRVTSRTSSMTFKDTVKDVKTIAGELGVRYVLEGSVRRAGSRLRITAQLIDASTDDHLWADTYDGAVEDVFAIQERLARVIVDALELRLNADEERRLAERPIADLQAYECYLRARQEGWRWRQDAIDHSIQLIRNGLEIIGDNARLYAALGLAYLQYRDAGLDVSENPLIEAETCARRVFALDPASASGLQLRGWIHYARGRIQEAVVDLKAALDIDPNNADTLLLLSNCYLISGQGPVARPLIDRLLAVDPLTPVSRCLPGWADVLDGNFAGAVEPYRQMFQMDPGNPIARLFYVWVLALNHRRDAVRAVVATCPPEMQDGVPARVALFLSHALAGNSRAAHDALTPAIEAVATTTDVFPRLLAQGVCTGGCAGARAALARDCRRSWLHQLSVPRAPRPLFRAPPERSTIPAADGDGA